MTLTLDGRPFVGQLALKVPDCPEIRALVLNVPMVELHLAAFDEALHPRRPRGAHGGGEFVSKLLHELKPGDTFEHPTLGRMERLAQGGAKRADGRLTVRSLTTGKRVHMMPTREVSIPAPKAMRVRKPSAGKRAAGPSTLSKELKARIGTPEAYHAAVQRMAGNRIVALTKAGSVVRGQLERDQHSPSGLRLTTATHILETKTPGRDRYNLHSTGMPEDLEPVAAKLRESKTIGGTGRSAQNIGKPSYEDVRIRRLGHVPAGEENATYHPARMEHARSEPFDPAEHQGVRLASAERGVINPQTVNKQFVSDKVDKPFKPGPVTRPAEGYFPGSENEQHTLYGKPKPRAPGYRWSAGGHGPEIARGTRREMEALQREHAGSVIAPPPLTTVRFVSPIDGQIVERQLTPSELEKFNRIVEKPPETRVAEAKRGFTRGASAGESIRAVPLSQVEPGTTYFDQHGEARGVRGVEKKGGIEVHESPTFGRATKPRIAQPGDIVHVKAGAQQSLEPGPQVGHVHVVTSRHGYQLVDNTGQKHHSPAPAASVMRDGELHYTSHDSAVADLRALNSAYDRAQQPAAAAAGGGGYPVQSIGRIRGVENLIHTAGTNHHPTTGERVVVHMRGDRGATIPRLGTNLGYMDGRSAYRIRLDNGTTVQAMSDQLSPAREWERFNRSSSAGERAINRSLGLVGA